MHDPKFEKVVQQKMHDLEFVPSESVWENIQQTVAPRRRRRALAFFWWLVPGMALLGTGVLLYHSHITTSSVAAAGVPTRGLEGTGAAVAKDPVVGLRSGGSAGAVAADGAGADRSGNLAGVDQADQKGGEAAGGAARTEATGGAVGTDRAGSQAAADHTSETGIGIAVGQSVDGDAVQDAAALSARVAYRGYQPGLIPSLTASAGVHAPRLSQRPVNTATSGLAKPNHSWMAGFAGGGGISTLDGPLTSSIASSAYYTSSSSNYNGSGAVPAPARSNVVAGGVKRSTSTIKPAASYWAGIFAEKPLSSRWSVDVGLNLHYYSTQLYSSAVTNNYAPSSASLITASALTYALAVSSPSGGTEQSYTNRYYFLEVPAAVQWKINRSRVLPLFWRGGVAFSYLMGSDALYYDEQSNSYNKDNTVVRHVQANVTTGLMVGLPVKGVRIQAGPEVQYGVTSLEATTSGSGHLFYGGMRLALLR